MLRVPLPAGIRAAMAPPTTRDAVPVRQRAVHQRAVARPRRTTESREGSELPETTETVRSPWPWFLGGFVGLGIIVVLMRSLRRR